VVVDDKARHQASQGRNDGQKERGTEEMPKLDQEQVLGERQELAEQDRSEAAADAHDHRQRNQEVLLRQVELPEEPENGDLQATVQPAGATLRHTVRLVRHRFALA